MLSTSELKQYLLHEEKKVRDFTVEYFVDSWSTDESLLPLVLQATEEYGADENWYSLCHAPLFMLTDDTLEELLGYMEKWGDKTTLSYLNSILARASIDLQEKHTEKILDHQNVFAKTARRVRRRVELAGEPSEKLWETLQEYSKEWNPGEPATGIDASDAKDIIDALSNRDVPTLDTIFEMLHSGEVRQSRLELWLIDLAGARRDPEAVPRLVEHYHRDDSLLLERVTDGLTRIGDPEAARLVGEWFEDEMKWSRLHAADLLAKIKHPVSEQVIVDVLQSEEDATVRTNLCFALCKLLSQRGLNIVRKEIERGYDRTLVNLEKEVVTVGRLLDVDIPEQQEWEKAEKRRQRPKKSSTPRMERPRGKSTQGDKERSSYDSPRRPESLEKLDDVGRNDPCPCGSGKKYKYCCGKVT